MSLCLRLCLCVSLFVFVRLFVCACACVCVCAFVFVFVFVFACSYFIRRTKSEPWHRQKDRVAKDKRSKERKNHHHLSKSPDVHKATGSSPLSLPFPKPKNPDRA